MCIYTFCHLPPIVELLAESLCEAAALGVNLLRDADCVDTLRPMTRLQPRHKARSSFRRVFQLFLL
jgi:hypothetical protein